MGLHFGQIVWVGLLALLLFLIFNEQAIDCNKCGVQPNNINNNNNMCSPEMSISYTPNNSASLSIVVFGASGDLASRKIFPALYSLFIKGALPVHTNIIGYARSKVERDEFEEKVTKNLRCKDGQKVKEFLSMSQYVQGKYDSKADLITLHNYLDKLETSTANRMYYFAVSPTVFIPLAQQLHSSCMSPSGWTRIVVEKPFGRDVTSFSELMDALSVFPDDQVYKIDHYLGKAMVQNLLVLRFANSIFESLWDRERIISVAITLKEDVGIEGRGSYFDEYGIIRDVMQNHLIQIMALIGMEQPKAAEARHIQSEKAAFLKRIAPVPLEQVVVGQFGPSLSGWAEKGYLDCEDDNNNNNNNNNNNINNIKQENGKIEENKRQRKIKIDSTTPTYAAAVLFVDNERWRDVPFILRCGKALDERKVEICIQFKSKSSIFREEQTTPNELVIRVQPDESISMKLVTKHPGLTSDGDGDDIVESEIDLSYKNKFGHVVIPDAYPIIERYERLLLDVVEGDNSLFLQNEELEEAWRIFTPLLNQLEQFKIKPDLYPFGSSGPERAHQLVENHGFKQVGKASR